MVDNRSIYYNDIELLLMHEMSKSIVNNFTNINMSLNGLLFKLFMINKNYNEGKNNMNKLSMYTEIPINTIWDFYSSTQSKLKDNLYRALNKMQSKCLINYEIRQTVCTKDYKYRHATGRERQIIVNIESEMLEEYNIKYGNIASKKDILLRGLWKDWKTDINILLENEDIIYYFDTIDIKASNKFKSLLLDENKINEIANNLNNNIAISCFKTANKSNIKATDFNITYDTKTKIKNRAEQNYINDTQRIIDLCIDINCNISLRNELENIKGSKVYTLWDAKDKEREIKSIEFIEFL